MNPPAPVDNNVHGLPRPAQVNQGDADLIFPGLHFADYGQRAHGTLTLPHGHILRERTRLIEPAKVLPVYSSTKSKPCPGSAG